MTSGTKNVEQDQFADIVVQPVRERFGIDAAAGIWVAVASPGLPVASS
jgi:hypothetical protein